MEGTISQREPRDVDVFLFSPHMTEETTLLMAPENSKTNQRLIGIETQLNTHTREVATVQEGLMSLSANLQSLRDRAVTSWQVITRVLLPLMGTVVGAAVVLYFGLSTQYNNRLPKEIEYGIYSSLALKDRFGTVDVRLTKIDDKLGEISRTLGLFRNASAVSTAILEATSVPKDQLAKAIPRVRSLFDFAKSSRTPLSASTYKRVSQRLFSHYLASKEPLKQEVWDVLAYAVTTRTSTDLSSAPVSDSEIEQARAVGNFFEGEIDLSQKTEWKNAIFRNAKIIISKPDNELVLDGVRFIDCDFQSIPQNASNQKLVQNLLVAPRPELSVTINSYRVLTPRYTGTSERKSDATR